MEHTYDLVYINTCTSSIFFPTYFQQMYQKRQYCIRFLQVLNAEKQESPSKLY